MRLLLKILFAPVILILTVFVWLCMGLLYCSAFLFGLAASIAALLGLAVLVTYSVKTGLSCWSLPFWSVRWDCQWRRHGCWENCRISGIGFRMGYMDKK